ncbi:CGNR zinc finger domain-containing protein [Streptomonospora sediminis]
MLVALPRSVAHPPATLVLHGHLRQPRQGSAPPARMSGEGRWVFRDRSPANSGGRCSVLICGARRKMRSHRTRAARAGRAGGAGGVSSR